MNRQCYVSLQSLVNQKIFQIYRYHDVTQAISGKSGSAKPCYCFYHLCTELKCFMLYMFYHTLGSELDLLPFISSLCINMVSTTFWALFFFFFGFKVVQPHDFFMELLAASVPGVSTYGMDGLSIHASQLFCLLVSLLSQSQSREPCPCCSVSVAIMVTLYCLIHYVQNILLMYCLFYTFCHFCSLILMMYKKFNQLASIKQIDKLK